MRLLLLLALLLAPAIAEAKPSRSTRGLEARAVRSFDMRTFRRAEPSAFPFFGARPVGYRSTRSGYAGAHSFRRSEARSVRSRSAPPFRRAAPYGFPYAGARFFRYGSARASYAGARTHYAGAGLFGAGERSAYRSFGERTARYARPFGFRYAGTRFFGYGSARTYYGGARTYYAGAGFGPGERRAYRAFGSHTVRYAPGFHYAGTRFFRYGRARTFEAGARSFAYVRPRTLQAGARSFRPPGTGTARGGAIVIGDSIAHGVRGACRCAGRTRVGATPRAVLGYLRRSGSLSGRTVILSSGASNAPRDLNSVEAQLAHLRRSGARVSLLGVGPRFGRLNPRLAAMAARHGARFMPIGRTRDGVHPSSYAGLAARGR